jgi:Cdc6-like AAA superfamily ATPase
MSRFKLRKGINVGGLAAETDPLLNEAFVDLGYLRRVTDTNDPAFLIVGRTGSGKTALIKQIKKETSQVSVLDPEELSMQYLHNSVLRTIAAWGVNLDIFYKYLWRHVCILELIRMRYGDADDVPSRIQQIFDLTQLFGRGQKKARQVSQDYLREYGEDYWVRTDTRIKKITAEFEEKLTSDAKLSAALAQHISGSVATGSGNRNLSRVESEVAQRAQTIVSDFQISALNSVVDTLERHGFNDPQKSYFIVIDDLDKNWMPDDNLYLDLIKSLLSSVHELNRRLRAVKIIVALRENIYYRVFQRAAKHEPQREKWEDVLVRLKWNEDDLARLVDNRLAQVFKAEYTSDVPTLRTLLPPKKASHGEESTDYIMRRTFLRPRDVIDFVNRCMAEAADGVTRVSWSTLTGG